jgi:hypothetical protein
MQVAIFSHWMKKNNDIYICAFLPFNQILGEKGVYDLALHNYKVLFGFRCIIHACDACHQSEFRTSHKCRGWSIRDF